MNLLTKKDYYLHLEEPMHVGGVNNDPSIDLTILRNILDDTPLIPSSTLKGVFRSLMELIVKIKLSTNEKGLISENPFSKFNINSTMIENAFGKGNEKNTLEKDNNKTTTIIGNKGYISFTDGETYLFPVRAYLQNEFSMIYIKCTEENDSNKNLETKFYVGEKQYTGKKQTQINNINVFSVSPQDFSFITKYHTEVRTHIALDYEQKTAKDGALWTEENLPRYSILKFSIFIDNLRISDEDNASLSNFINILIKDKELLQVGANASTGFGLVRILDDLKNI